MRRLIFAFAMLVCFVSPLVLNVCAQRAGKKPKWSQLAELTPTDRMNQDWFGVSIAISGNTVIIGDFDSNLESTGAAYVYVKSGQWGNMTQTAKLTPSDGGTGFGTSVAISGDTIIVGAGIASQFDGRFIINRSQSSAVQKRFSQISSPQDAGPGAAYIFVKPPGGWTDMTETAKLTASDGVDGDAFGYNVSISGNTATVGALFAHGGAGAAYVFVSPPGGWASGTQTAILTASDSSSFDSMGAAAISGNTVITGAYGHNNFSGAAYIFVEPPGGWTDMTETAELDSKKSNQIYGFSVAIDGGNALVGAVGAHKGVGAAFLYEEPEGGWQSTKTYNARLSATPESGVSGLSQGISISGNIIALGAPGTTVGSNSGQGAVLVYVEPQAGWKTTSVPTAKLIASDGAANDNLGVSAAVDAGTVVGGATKSGPPGEAYVFGMMPK